MNHCRDCRHWGNSYDSGRSERECVRISNDTFSYNYDDPRRSELAHTSGAYGQESDLQTHADFGCVLWEPKQ